MKVFGAGQWLEDRHGARSRRSWRNLDADSGEIIAECPTDQDIGDASQVEPLLDQIDGEIGQFTTDGTYDKVFRSDSEAPSDEVSAEDRILTLAYYSSVFRLPTGKLLCRCHVGCQGNCQEDKYPQNVTVVIMLASLTTLPMVAGWRRATQVGENPHAASVEGGFAPRQSPGRMWYKTVMRLFALKGSENLGAAVARALWTDLDPSEERDFEDGEHKARPLVSVRGEDVYILHSLAGSIGASVNDKLCKLLFFIATCRDNGASSVTALVPYLAYARKDRQTKSHDPVTTRYIAQLFEAVGTNRVIGLEVHNLAAFQNAFRCETVHLNARQIFCPRIRDLADSMPIAFFSPDEGGAKRAQLLKEAFEADTGLDTGFGFMEKRRSRGIVSGELFAGDIEGAAVFIVDDMISTGGTTLRAAKACRDHGAATVFAVATHGLFTTGIEQLLESPIIDRIVVTDSVAAALEAAKHYPKARLEIVPVGPLIGEAVRRLHTRGSIGDLLGMED